MDSLANLMTTLRVPCRSCLEPRWIERRSGWIHLCELVRAREITERLPCPCGCPAPVTGDGPAG
jgi:hypothetical protein